VSSAPGPVLTDVQADDSGTFVIGLRENTTPEAWSLLLFESADEPDEQDLDLDMDTYCVVVDPGQATTYGGVLECELRDTSLRLRLAGSAATDLGLPPDTTFPLEVSAAQLATLRRGLRRVFTSGQPGHQPRLTGL
jgi:hypothetical protein